MSTIKSYQEQIQEIVAKAISAVEEQHKALASASFGYAGKVYSIDTLKAKHDDYAYVPYAKARLVNDKVADVASDIIAKFVKPETTVEKAKTTAKKATTAAKKTATKAKATATKTAKSAAKKVEAATA